MQDTKGRVSFADLDTFLKVAPMIGLFVLGYLQTLFPSKIEFEKIEQQLIQMGKTGEVSPRKNVIGNFGEAYDKLPEG